MTKHSRLDNDVSIHAAVNLIVYAHANRSFERWWRKTLTFVHVTSNRPQAFGASAIATYNDSWTPSTSAAVVATVPFAFGSLAHFRMQDSESLCPPHGVELLSDPGQRELLSPN